MNGKRERDEWGTFREAFKSQTLSLPGDVTCYCRLRHSKKGLASFYIVKNVMSNMKILV